MRPLPLALLLLAVVAVASGCGDAPTTAPPPARHVHVAAATPKRPHPRAVVLQEQPTGSLAAPVQDEAIARVPGGAMLLGGLTAADQSRTDVRVAGAHGDRAAGSLPVALHDTAAVAIGPSVYLFGGGTGANTQSDGIWRLSARGGAVTTAGTLPAPSSDQSAAALGGTAYVVGGYTGAAWLDTIVAWRPGGRARVVAHLPTALRYAAVASAGRELVIAGGSLPDGTASTAVYAFRPGAARVTRIASLPAPTTHATAATLRGIVYVIGGRSAALDTPTARIVSVDPRTHRVRAAGTLASARSDLAAATVGTRILLAGGRGADGTEGGLSVLAPRTRARTLTSVYAHDRRGALTGAARDAKPYVYVPNSQSDTVDVIDQRTMTIVEHFRVGVLPQHVVPAWDLRTLYVTNDVGNSLTAIDPRTGKPGRTIPVPDPYNLYFTPDGRYAVVVAERLQRLDFRDPHTFALRHALHVACQGVDHLDFTADGTKLLASCEFSGQMLVVDVAQQRVVRTIDLRRGAMPQDVKLSPDGRVFYVADMASNGVWEIDARTFRVLKLQPTGAGAHGLYPSRDSRYLYVSNRSAGSISVLAFRTRRIVATWHIPGGGSPDMGGVSADGKVLWLSGRYSGVVYAISTSDGRLLARIRVGSGPHGVCVWPQPGRYSLGHTGILR